MNALPYTHTRKSAYAHSDTNPRIRRMINLRSTESPFVALDVSFSLIFLVLFVLSFIWPGTSVLVSWFSIHAQRREQSQCVFDLLHIVRLPALLRLYSLWTSLRLYLCVYKRGIKRESSKSRRRPTWYEWWLAAACSRCRLCVCNFYNELLSLGAQYVAVNIETATTGGLFVDRRRRHNNDRAATKHVTISYYEKCTLCDVVHNRWNIFLFSLYIVPFSTVDSSCHCYTSGWKQHLKYILK